MGRISGGETQADILRQTRDGVIKLQANMDNLSKNFTDYKTAQKETTDSHKQRVDDLEKDLRKNERITNWLAFVAVTGGGGTAAFKILSVFPF